MYSNTIELYGSYYNKFYYQYICCTSDTWLQFSLHAALGSECINQLKFQVGYNNIKTHYT